MKVAGFRSFSVGEKRLRIRPIKKNARSILLLYRERRHVYFDRSYTYTRVYTAVKEWEEARQR